MQPYRIHVPDAVLADLRERLDRTRWPDVPMERGWTAGAGLDDIRALCSYWRDEYDWRRAEARLNAIPQFLVNVDGVDLHFLHVRSKSPGAIPLLLLHGWPGSVVEFLDLIAPLTEPGDASDGPAFDVVIPSLPGFGFSGKPRDSGWHADRCARAFNTLMTQILGYSTYGIQGGDWGSIIGARMAHAFGASIRGLHLNMPFAYPPDSATPEAKAFAGRLDQVTGYLHLQNTRPDAIGVGLSDSPAGLAAWVLEKFYSWSDCGGRVLEHFSKDTLLTNLMFYWAPNSAASAARIYFESASLQPPLFLLPRISVPTGIADFPREPYRAPRVWLEERYNIVSWTTMPSGGHFPALEEPDLLVGDVRRFFATAWKG